MTVETDFRFKGKEFLTALKELLSCPIGTHLFENPVTTPSGYTYERSSIEFWLATNPNDPLAPKVPIPDEKDPTNIQWFSEPLNINELQAELLIKQLMEDYKKFTAQKITEEKLLDNLERKTFPHDGVKQAIVVQDLYALVTQYKVYLGLPLLGPDEAIKHPDDFSDSPLIPTKPLDSPTKADALDKTNSTAAKKVKYASLPLRIFLGLLATVTVLPMIIIIAVALGKIIAENKKIKKLTKKEKTEFNKTLNLPATIFEHRKSLGFLPRFEIQLVKALTLETQEVKIKGYQPEKYDKKGCVLRV